MSLLLPAMALGSVLSTGATDATQAAATSASNRSAEPLRPGKSPPSRTSGDFLAFAGVPIFWSGRLAACVTWTWTLLTRRRAALILTGARSSGTDVVASSSDPGTAASL